MSDGGDLVPVAQCSDNFEATAMRAFLEANGVRAHVQGENHRALLGPFGTYIALNVLVGEADLDKARALIEDFQSGVLEGPENGNPPPRRRRHRRRAATAETGEALHPIGPYRAPARPPLAVPSAAELERRVRISRNLALVPSFGAGLVYAGAPLRGLGLAVMQTMGLWLVLDGQWWAVALVAAAVAFGAWLAPMVVRERAAATAERTASAEPDDNEEDNEDDEEEDEDEDEEEDLESRRVRPGP